MLFCQIVQDFPSQSVPGFGHLEDNDPSVGLRGPFSDQILVQEGLRQTAGCTLFQIEMIAEVRDGHRAVLDQCLKSVALANGDVVTAGPVSVPELEDPYEFPQGLLESGCIPEKGRVVDRPGGSCNLRTGFQLPEK